MVDWVAVVLKNRQRFPDCPPVTSTAVVSGDQIAEPLLNETTSGRLSSEPAPISQGQYCRFPATVPGPLITYFNADDLIERFCIQTVDGELNDSKAIESIVTSLPPLSYDAILAEVAPSHIPTSEDHAEAIFRWMEFSYVQRQHATELLKAFGGNNISARKAAAGERSLIAADGTQIAIQGTTNKD